MNRIKRINSKGFTLVELLAVVVIISVVLLLAFVLVNSIISNSKDDIDKKSKQLVLDAASYYVAEFRNVNDESWKETLNEETNIIDFCVSLSSLVNSGYYKGDDNTLEDLNDKYFVYVSLKKEDGVYNYELIDSGDENKCNDKIN